MLNKVTALLRQWIARRKKHWRALQNSKLRMDELADAIESGRAEVERLERVITRRRKRSAPVEKIERTADRLEAARGAVDQLLIRADQRRQKNHRLLDAIQADTKRVKDLRQRRQRIIRESEGKIGDFWHIREFDCNDGTDCPAYMEQPLDDLAKRVLDPLRRKFGAGHVNSGYRTVSWNQAVGGEPNSYHVYTIRKSQPAADCTFASGRPSDWAAYARSLGVGGVGQYATFVHVDTGPRRDWWG